MYHLRPLLPFIILLASASSVSAQKLTDTIFFTGNWKICEKEIAKFYRIGTLAIDSFWFYTGRNTDYTMDHQILMEGNYSLDGYKNGLFKYYYPNGNLHASGQYINDKLMGDWQWFYPDGTERASIYFAAADQSFSFKKYRSEEGDTTLKNGTGKFIWYTYDFDMFDKGLSVYGTFKDGRKDGTWKYYRGKKAYNNLLCKETWDEGIFKKRKGIAPYFLTDAMEREPESFSFEPVKIKITENIEYDHFFKRNGEDKAGETLIKYLKERRSTTIELKDSSFEYGISYILKTLMNYSYKIDYWHKDVSGKIEFRIGDSRHAEDISVEGENISKEEKDFLVFLMKKFNNIEMPGTKDVGIEAYHTIYFYSLDTKEFWPVEVRKYIGKELFFTDIKKEKLLEMFRSKKHEIRKYIRKELFRYW